MRTEASDGIEPIALVASGDSVCATTLSRAQRNGRAKEQAARIDAIDRRRINENVLTNNHDPTGSICKHGRVRLHGANHEFGVCIVCWCAVLVNLLSITIDTLSLALSRGPPATVHIPARPCVPLG